MNNGTTSGLMMVVVFVVGLLIGYYAGSNNVTVDGVVTDVEEVTNRNDTATPPNTYDTTEESDANTQADTQAETEAVTTLDTSKLTPGQRQLLETLGVDADSITITPEMIACAEAKIGAARVAEIQNGATPSFMEGASLMACYSN